jgi:hypothetical protein
MRRREFIAGLGAAITGSIPTDAQELSRLLLVSSGKRIQLDDETWHALNQLANDRVQDFQELADEAFADLLQKHGRPTDLKTALRQSVGVTSKRPPRPYVTRGGGGKTAGKTAGGDLF